MTTSRRSSEERVDAEIGGDYIAASADLRAGDHVEGSFKELVDTGFRGDYIAASAEIGR